VQGAGVRGGSRKPGGTAERLFWGAVRETAIAISGGEGGRGKSWIAGWALSLFPSFGVRGISFKPVGRGGGIPALGKEPDGVEEWTRFMVKFLKGGHNPAGSTKKRTSEK